MSLLSPVLPVRLRKFIRLKRISLNLNLFAYNYNNINIMSYLGHIYYHTSSPTPNSKSKESHSSASSTPRKISQKEDGNQKEKSWENKRINIVS